MKIKPYIAYALIFLVSCTSVEEEMQEKKSCIRQLASQNGRSEAGEIFLMQLADSVDFWVNTIDLPFMQDYKESGFVISDKVLFNSSESKGIGFLIKYRGEGQANDVVQVITGEKIADDWSFYLIGNFTLLFTRCDACDEKYDAIPLEEIEERMLENMISAGYFRKGCIIDDEKFDEDWVTDAKRAGHQYRLLTGTYPKYHERFSRDSVDLPVR